MSDKSKRRLFFCAVIAVCIGAFTVIYLYHFDETEDEINWDLTLIGKTEKVLTFADIRAMPSYEGYGGFFTTVGMKNGPFRCRGVPIEELCELVGGINDSNTLWVSAPDGYLMVFTYDQVTGNFFAYEPTSLNEVPHVELEIILMYEKNGKRLSIGDGGPLRIAIVSDQKIMTEGHYWVKWIDNLEIRTPGI